MKPLSTLSALVSVLFLGACADPLEKRTTEEVGAQLERGVTGQGQLGPMNRMEGDEAAKHSVPQTHP